MPNQNTVLSYCFDLCAGFSGVGATYYFGIILLVWFALKKNDVDSAEYLFLVRL